MKNFELAFSGLEVLPEIFTFFEPFPEKKHEDFGLFQRVFPLNLL